MKPDFPVGGQTAQAKIPDHPDHHRGAGGGQEQEPVPETPLPAGYKKSDGQDSGDDKGAPTYRAREARPMQTADPRSTRRRELSRYEARR